MKLMKYPHFIFGEQAQLDFVSLDILSTFKNSTYSHTLYSAPTIYSTLT